MQTDLLTWDLVDAAAADLGVTGFARKKWQQRRQIPFRWRYPLIERLRARGHDVDYPAFDALLDGAPAAEPAAAGAAEPAAA